MSLHNQADLQANHDHFISRVKESGIVWGLSLDDGWVICPSNHAERQVMPFWSDEAFARRHAVAEWAGYTPTQIDLASFLAHWLPGMDEDEMLVGVNFNTELAGLEIEPAELSGLLAEK